MIIVCPLAHAHALIEKHGARHAVSLLGPGTDHPSFDRIGGARHLRLTFHDIVAPMDGFVAPEAQDTLQIIEFFRGWDRQEPMLIHCWAGISRSTAAAFTALCMVHEEIEEAKLARQLRQRSPSATPNRLIVSQADDILGRGGRMVDAIDRIGRGADAYEGQPFVLWP
jgi:predicted protein tyrosine phosphatase